MFTEWSELESTQTPLIACAYMHLLSFLSIKMLLLHVTRCFPLWLIISFNHNLAYTCVITGDEGILEMGYDECRIIPECHSGLFVWGTPNPTKVCVGFLLLRNGWFYIICYLENNQRLQNWWKQVWNITGPLCEILWNIQSNQTCSILL